MQSKTSITTTLLLACFVLTQSFGPSNCQLSQLADTAAGFIPTVVVDNQSGDSSVDVHLSNLVNLSTDDLENLQSRVDLNVLGGLVTVNTNRTRLPSGQSSGPVIVTVFGIPVYVGQGTSKPKPVTPKAPKPELPNINSKPVVPQSAALLEAPRAGPKIKAPRVEKDKQAEAPIVQSTVTKSDKPDLNKTQIVELLSKMAQKISDQEKIIKELKGSQTREIRASPTTETTSSTEPIAVDDSTKPRSIGFEQISDMLRNRRNQFREDHA